MSASTTAALTEEDLPGRTAQLRRRALLTGGIGLGVWLLLALFSRAAFPAYLAAYVFVLGLAVGSLGFLMLHHLVGGQWGFVVRRPLEAATMTLPLMALLFLPIVLGMRSLYEWADPEAVKASALLQQKAGYLNVGFWLVRAVIYFGIWIGLAYLIRRGSVAQDATEDPSPTYRNQAISGPGLVITFLVVTFAAIDWMMSIEPEWYSTIYGVMVMIGWAVSTLAMLIVVAAWLSDVRPLAGLADEEGFHDLGNLLLAFTMLWAYMSFSQYLIIWMGDLTEEVPWYLKRSYGGWRLVCGALIVFHFFVPFFCLLVRANKRRPARLWRVAAVLLVMHLVNDAWLIIPAFPTQWLQLLALAPALAGVGGLWLWAFLGGLTSRPLLPRHDPLLAAVLSHHGGGH
jgi:hypothetical protein